MANWLTDFVAYASSGECSERLAYWVGVSTVAAVLRRKVWLTRKPHYEWSPNFYILIVGPTGVKKNTAINYGYTLLEKMEEINLGPDGTTWQALIEYISQKKETVILPNGEKFDMSCVSLGVGEFGVFFKLEEREFRDNLTNLWDSKRGTVKKMTKTSGCDEIVNPWINLISGTTPNWLSSNFTEDMIREGFANRVVYLFEPAPPKEKDDMFPPDVSFMESNLLSGLSRMAMYAGPMEWSPEAEAFLPGWYSKIKDQERALGEGSLEGAFMARKVVHMGKLAMVIAASQGSFPKVELSHVMEAIERLEALEGDTTRALGTIGQAKIPAATRMIVDAVRKAQKIDRARLYREQFMRTLTKSEFKDAVDGAIDAELIMELKVGIGEDMKSILMARGG